MILHQNHQIQKIWYHNADNDSTTTENDNELSETEEEEGQKPDSTTGANINDLKEKIIWSNEKICNEKEKPNLRKSKRKSVII